MADLAPAVPARHRALNLSQKLALNTALLVGGRLAVSLSGLVGTIVATRYLGVYRFGELQTAVTFAALFAVLTDAGVWTIAAREVAQRPEDEQRILSTAAAIGVVLGLGTAALMLIGTFALYPGADRHFVRIGILLLALPVLLTSPLGTSSTWLVARQSAVPGALAGLAAGTGFLIALTVVIQADLGFTGIVVAYLVSALLNAFVPILYVGRQISLRPRWDAELGAKLIRRAIPQGFVVAITAIYFRVDVVLISVLSNDREVALYGVSFRVLEFLLLVPVMMSITIFPELARAAAGSERLRRLMQGMFSAVLVVAVPMLCIGVGFAPEIVRIAGGREFDDGEDVLRLLIVAVAFSFEAGVFFSALVALDEQGRLARRMLVVLTFNVALNAVFVGRFGAAGASVALVLSEIASLALAWQLFEETGQRIRPQRLGRLALAGVACAAVAGVFRLCTSVPAGHPIIVVVTGTAACLVVFAAAVVALRALPEEVLDGVRQLQRRRPSEDEAQ